MGGEAVAKGVRCHPFRNACPFACLSYFLLEIPFIEVMPPDDMRSWIHANLVCGKDPKPDPLFPGIRMPYRCI